MCDIKIYKVSFMLSDGRERNGWIKAYSLAGAMTYIAGNFPSISHIYWIDEDEEITEIPEYCEI